MSAYICSSEVFNAIATYAQRNGLLGDDSYNLFLAYLVAENHKSVNYRYSEKSALTNISILPVVKTAQEIIELCKEYEHQANEHPGWPASEVKHKIDAIRAHAESVGAKSDRNAPVRTTTTEAEMWVKNAIVNYLAACEPAGIEDICEDVRIQCGLKRQNVLPAVITGLAALMAENKIQEYEQMPIDDPLEYAWELVEVN